MNRLDEIMEKLKTRHNDGQPITAAELQKRQCEAFNKRIGNRNETDGYNCDKCKNKGEIYYISDTGYLYVKECECMNVRRAFRRAEKSGLRDIWQKFTFDNYIAEEPWQQVIKKKAQDFCTDEKARWFYIGGQVGAGKSHLCTAIAAHYIMNGLDCKYMLWRDEAVKLKALVNSYAEYQQPIKELKEAAVLYIDDFLKTQNKSEPTAADINLAFEILNNRLLDESKITIISSEYTLPEALTFDEATISRIWQQTGQYKVNISKDIKKNYRLKG